MKDNYNQAEVLTLLTRQRKRMVDAYRSMGTKRFLRYQSKIIEETLLNAFLTEEDYEV